MWIWAGIQHPSPALADLNCCKPPFIPFGGRDITRDIATHFGFNEDRAEKIEGDRWQSGHQPGAAALNDTNIDHAATLFNAKSFEHADLSPVIEARVRGNFVERSGNPGKPWVCPPYIPYPDFDGGRRADEGAAGLQRKSVP